MRNMARKPIVRALSRGCFGEREVRRADNRDEEINLDLLAGRSVDDRWSFARVVDEDLLAGLVHLTHRELRACGPRVVERDELRIAVAVRMRRRVFLVQRPERHAVSSEFDVDLREIRHRSCDRRRGARVNPRVELVVAQHCHVVPRRESCSLCSNSDLARRSDADTERRCNLAMAALLQLQS